MKNGETSLILITKAEQMLVKATTIQKAKELKDLALTAKQWATRKGLGKEIINHCHVYAIRAEIRMGELLIATERAKGTDKGGRQYVDGHHPLPSNPPPTLAELHISKNESAQAQKLAEAPKEIKKKADAGEISHSRALQMVAKADREEARHEAALKIEITNPGIIVGDFRDHAEEIPDGSLNLIFTDPPYSRKDIDLLPGLAEFAAAKLADGGSLLCYVGHLQLMAALEIFKEKLRFWWIICCLHSGGNTLMREYGIYAGWKPILWFVKKTRDNPNIIVNDVISGGKEKDRHEWQQAEAEAEYWINKLCPEGGFVCDPFLGSGTTAIAAAKLGRKWMGFEIDTDTAKMASKRISEL